jgi:CRP-like cAMP-binding protein
MADLFDRILMLKKSPIFAHVDTDTLRLVAQELVEEMYFAGERVFDIGDEGDHVYIVESGKAGVSIHADPAAKEFIATLGVGECFGEMNMFDDLPRSATVHVVEDAKLLSLEKSKLRGLMMKYPALGLGLLRGMSLRLRATNIRALGNKN